MDTNTTFDIPVRFILVDVTVPLEKSPLTKVEVALVAAEVEREIIRSMNEMAYAE